MPRYFFHVLDGKAAIDTVGLELANMDRVRKEAIRVSGQMVSDGDCTWTGNAWQMIVTNVEGDIVFSISVAVDRHGL